MLELGDRERMFGNADCRAAADSSRLISVAGATTWLKPQISGRKLRILTLPRYVLILSDYAKTQGLKVLETPFWPI